MQKNAIKYRLVYLWLTVSITSSLLPHGFSEGTLIAVDTGLHELKQLCHEITKDLKAHQVESLQIFSKQRISCPIASVAQSETNCFCNFVVGNPETVICCTPLQQFYVTTEQCWKTAYELQNGDNLLTTSGASCKVHAITFVKMPLHVYNLEIEDTHIFAVTQYRIITHNIFLPGVVVSLSIPWGAGAGGTFGGFFGPVTCIVGVAIGGIIGLMWQKCSTSQIPHYEVVLNANYFDTAFKQRLIHYNESTALAELTPDTSNQTEGATKSVENLIKETQPGRKTNGKTRQFVKQGDYQKALDDFKSLPVQDVYTDGETTIGTLPDGVKVNVRPNSSHGAPTLEVRTPRPIKIRYE